MHDVYMLSTYFFFRKGMTNLFLLFSFPKLNIILCYISAEAENEDANSESKAAKEAIDIKELKRVDHILASLQRKVT